MEDICRTASWSSPSLFIRHYQLNTYASAEASFGRRVLQGVLDTREQRFRNQLFYDKDKQPCHGFELPKPLTTCDVAVRILHTRYDHLSPFHDFPKELPKLDLPSTVTEATQSSNQTEIQTEDRETLKDVSEIKTDASARTMTISDVFSYSERRRSSSSRGSGSREDHYKSSFFLRSTSRAHVSALRLFDISELDILEDYTVDLHQFMSVGGVYHCNLLKLPPQAKQVKGWTIVEVLDTGLETYPYAASCEDSEDNSAVTVGITIHLSDSVIYFEEPLIARWDNQARESLGLYCGRKPKPVILLPALENLKRPFLPRQDNQCMIYSVATIEDSDLLMGLREKWMSPMALMMVLKRAGMNIFPAEYSSKYVSVNKKTFLAEMMVYQQMSLVATSFAFGWSKWNLKSGENNLVFKACEHLSEEEQIQEEEWALYMFNSQRAQKLAIDEESDVFSKNIAEGSEFHSTLYHLLKDTGSKDAMDRVRQSNYLFIDAVYQLLLATRVLTYS
ncbi:PREDICTED: protein CASC1 [Thamnophis sirtalis]|uniref:Protein CASC1 n=1 Tax=Thamnophis sirtalis TaxID=35019 RepID=A0A6I9YS90_9SAUR|nr:PREDICTED: protein CASC1 [Thamnophis sirtalis]